MTRRIKQPKVFEIDGITYTSRHLYEYHLQLKRLQEHHIIQSFCLNVPTIKKYNKYSNLKPTINDIKFDSLAESRFYIVLLIAKRNGLILDYKRQYKFELIPAYKKNGKTIRPMAYIADFVIANLDGSYDVIDIKGIETDVFKIKKKLFEYKYQHLNLICYQYNEAHHEWRTLEDIKQIRKDKKKALKKEMAAA